MFAVQASLVMCIVQEHGENCLLCVSLILEYGFCKWDDFVLKGNIILF